MNALAKNPRQPLDETDVGRASDLQSDLEPVSRKDVSSEDMVVRCLQLGWSVTVTKMVHEGRLLDRPEKLLRLGMNEQYQGVAIGLPIPLHRGKGRSTSVAEIYRKAEGVYWVVTRSGSAYLLTGIPNLRGA